MKFKEIQENTSQNELFASSGMRLKNASFANRDHQTYAKRLVLGGKFFLELGSAENHVFPEKTTIKNFLNVREAHVFREK